MKLKQYLTEKQIIISNGAKYGQIVFLAGGAGSGKGFSSTNFMEKSKFKVRDVDELKLAAIKLAKLKGDDPEIANLNLGNPDDVFKLHQYVKDKGWKNETLDLLLKSAQNPDTLPNILFDVTLKDEGDIYEVLPVLFEVGYKPINVHLVWILTNYEVAVKQNAERERKVPDEILLKTHTGAALTMTDMMRGKIKGIGTVIDGSINVILGGKKHTIIMTTADTKETIKGKNKFVQLDAPKIERKGQLVIKSFKYITIKHQGKPMRSSDDFMKDMFNWDDLRNWVKDNIPKTKQTKNIRRRKRI
jgi:dephospho-CoA kinase